LLPLLPLYPLSPLLHLSHFSSPLLCFLLLPRPPPPTLFPYTTLFRSLPVEPHRRGARRRTAGGRGRLGSPAGDRRRLRRVLRPAALDRRRRPLRARWARERRLAGGAAVRVLAVQAVEPRRVPGRVRRRGPLAGG